MITFSKLVFVEDIGEHEFCFDRILTPTGSHYHVKVRSRTSNTYHFTMRERDARWQIVDGPLPAKWVIDVERELSDAINECLMEVIKKVV